jgi:RNA polymerase sporulation-specific sigma factor
MDLPASSLAASSDEALVGVIQRGDGSGDSAEAFGLLLERTLPVIHARVNSAVSHADKGRLSSREDLLQEGKLAFLSAVSTYRPGKGASFRTYVSVCVNHRVVSALRRSAKVFEEALPEEFLIPGARAMDPQDIFAAMEETRRIMEAMHSQLSRLERSVTEGYLAGESYEALARRLNVGPKTVDNALQRVRKKLRKYL